jgi:hypothetical protein
MEYYMNAMACSTTVERFFSKGGQIVTDERQSLLPDNLCMWMNLAENITVNN